MGLVGSRLLSYITGDENTRYLYNTAEFHIVSRDDWSARPSRQVTMKSSPAITYRTELTGGEGCSSKGQCARSVKRLQNIHMDLMELHDIGYSFLIGGDGSVFEGRGWKTVCNCTNQAINSNSNIKPEENINDDNQRITIGFIGDKETEVMKEAVAKLLEYGKKYKYFGESKHASDDEEES